MQNSLFPNDAPKTPELSMNTNLTNRFDLLLLFDVTNGNPNGDPDAGNQPRLEPNSGRGLVSDVCIKRKIRNYVAMFAPVSLDEGDNARHFQLLVQQGNVIETKQKKAEAKAAEQLGIDPEPKKTAKKSDKARENDQARLAADWLCRQFFDVRTFGGVLATGEGVMKGSAYGQVRGPVQCTFSQSYHPINPLDITITRLVVTTEKDAAEDKERTMGHKYIVPYGLYSGKIFVSPPFAEKTSFNQRDLYFVCKSLLNMFEQDHSAARGDMRVQGLYAFEHVGTQHPNNALQNQKEARLGCAHAHRLFDGIQVNLTDAARQKGYPESFGDYEIVCKWDSEPLPAGVKLHKLHELSDAELRALFVDLHPDD